jgi:hypothetical protein
MPIDVIPLAIILGGLLLGVLVLCIMLVWKPEDRPSPRRHRRGGR